MKNSLVLHVNLVFRTVCFLVLGVAAATAAETIDVLPVWDFNDGLRTDQGGDYNHFARSPSSASAHLTREDSRGGRALKIVYDKQSAGYCGVWLHTFNEESPADERDFVDLETYPWLSFHVRGETGGEDFTVQMADPFWLSKEDSRPAGLVSGYLGKPVDTSWQEVIVPVKDFRLRDPQAATITFNFTGEGQGTVYIDDVVFKKGPEVPVPVSAPAEAPKQTRDIKRLMWVWKTLDMLEDPAAQDELIRFCNEHRVSELFLQLVYEFENRDSAAPRVVIDRPDALRAMLQRLRAGGVTAHALDGFPEFVLTEHHAKVLALVDAVIAFNAASEPEERFTGIHLDNEPYQLLGFESTLQDSILTQFFNLNAKVMERLDQAESEMVYGVDVPFWFDERKDADIGDCVVTYRGKTADAAVHLIDLLDNVGIMDYRNFAGGTDGMIGHARGELAYGDKAGKDIYLGVETFKYKPTDVYFVGPVPMERWMNPNPDQRAAMLASQYNGLKVRAFKGQAGMYIGLARNPDGNEREVLDALSAMARLFLSENETLNEAAVGREIKALPNYSGLVFNDIHYSGDKQIRSFKVVENMLDKITFAGKTKADIDSVLAEVADFCGHHPSLAGFAIHFYDTYRQLPNE